MLLTQFRPSPRKPAGWAKSCEAKVGRVLKTQYRPSCKKPEIRCQAKHPILAEREEGSSADFLTISYGR